MTPQPDNAFDARLKILARQAATETLPELDVSGAVLRRLSRLRAPGEMERSWAIVGSLSAACAVILLVITLNLGIMDPDPIGEMVSLTVTVLQ